MKPAHVSVGDGAIKFIEAMRGKGATSIEFGYDPLDGSDDDPPPGQPVRWWATARRHGTLFKGEYETADHTIGILEALAACAREMGLSVRLRYE